MCQDGVGLPGGRAFFKPGSSAERVEFGAFFGLGLSRDAAVVQVGDAIEHRGTWLVMTGEAQIPRGRADPVQVDQIECARLAPQDFFRRGVMRSAPDCEAFCFQRVLQTVWRREVIGGDKADVVAERLKRAGVGQQGL